MRIRGFLDCGFSVDAWPIVIDNGESCSCPGMNLVFDGFEDAHQRSRYLFGNSPFVRSSFVNLRGDRLLGNRDAHTEGTVQSQGRPVERMSLCCNLIGT